MERVELTGQELQQFVRALASRDVDLLRLWVDGGLKYKIDGGCWSPPIGELRTDEY